MYTWQELATIGEQLMGESYQEAVDLGITSFWWRKLALELSTMIDFHPYRCPTCGNMKTHQRTGVHFEHERRCGHCNTSYDPDVERQKYLQQEQARLALVTHRE